MTGQRWGAWALVASVLAFWLVGLVAGERPLSSPADRPAALHAVGDAPVVLVGVPGLTWDLVDPATTPTLHRLASEGASAALVVRGTHEVTCAADAWLTLGAGQRAATDVIGCGDTGFAEEVTDPAAGVSAFPRLGDIVTEGGVDPAAWHRWQEAAERRALGPELGSLNRVLGAEDECVVGYGPGAVLAAAGPDGTVTEAALGPLLPDDLVPGCAVHLMSTPAVGGQAGQLGRDPEARRIAILTEVDLGVGRLMERLPDGSRLVVAGMGHTSGRAEATVLVSTLVGAPAEPQALGSESTRQSGLVQLTDLTAGLVEAVGATPDDRLAGGRPLLVQEPRPVPHARDLATGVSEAKRLAPWALGALAVVVLPALALAVALGRRRAVAVVASVAMAVPVATLLAGLVPWWRAERTALALVAAILGVATVLAVVAWAGRWRRDPLGPPAWVAAVTLTVLGLDVLHGSRLGLVSVLGLQPVTAGRFYGQGNVGFGIMLGAFLVVSAVLVSRLPPRESAVAVLVLGTATVLLNAAPQAGADFGGVPGTVLATGLLVLSALGLRWRPGSLLLLALAGAVVAAAGMVADWVRGPDRRTHLGNFVQSVLDGEAGGIVARKLDQSLGILVSYPLSWLAVLALVLVTVAAATRRPGWTAPLWREPGVRPAYLAGAVAMVVTWALNDSGIAAVALTLALLIGLAIGLLARGTPLELPGKSGHDALPPGTPGAAGSSSSPPERSR